MTFDLSGRVALITGGSRGLGRRSAEALAAAGADVVVVSRKLDACERAAAEIREATGRRVLPLAYHAGHWDEAEPLIDRVLAEFGRLDVLVNNAGMSPLYKSLPEVSEPLWDKVIAVNLKGPFRLSVLAAEVMNRGDGGSIINISSMASRKARPHNLPYAAAKAGLNALTIGLAHAYGPKVRVNAILAGTFLTDVSKAWDPEEFARRAAGFALKRGGQPEEITGTVLYLASDASSYTTGSLIAVDGGQP